MRTRLHVGDDTPHGAEVEAHVETLAAATGLDRSETYRLRLAAEEIVTNVALHGYHSGRGVVDLESGTEDGLVWLRIEDDAPRFDPRSHPGARSRPDPASATRPGGFGLFLAMTCVDDFHYEYHGGRNRCTLRLRPGGRS